MKWFFSELPAYYSIPIIAAVLTIIVMVIL